MQKSRQVALLEMQYAIEDQQRANDALTQQLSFKSQQNRLYIIGGVLIGLLCLLLLGLILQKIRHNRSLEHTVTNRTIDLATSNNKLAMANDELKEFAYITSHCRLPLSRYRSIVEILMVNFMLCRRYSPEVFMRS